jgi:glycosyltransferase involved in cell wall biosynthesis
MKTQETFAVLICYFNEGPLLETALTTLFTQQVAPDEVLVYDNGSSIPAQAHIHPEWPVGLIRAEENRGPSYARNRLAEVARSEFVHFHDADDVFSPDFTREIRQVIQEKDVDVIINQVRSSDSERARALISLEHIEENANLLDFAVRRGITLQAGTVRRSLVLKIGGFDESLWYNEDPDFYWRVAQTTNRWTVINRPLVIKTERKDSLGRVNTARRLRHLLASYEKAFHALPDTYATDIAGMASGLAALSARAHDQDVLAAAVHLASCAGGLSFPGRNRFYRFIAESGGVKYAEALSTGYQRLKHSLVKPAEKATIADFDDPTDRLK